MEQNRTGSAVYKQRRSWPGGGSRGPPPELHSEIHAKRKKNPVRIFFIQGWGVGGQTAADDELGRTPSKPISISNFLCLFYPRNSRFCDIASIRVVVECSDDDADWSSENSPPAAARPGGSQAGPLLGVRSSGPSSSNGDVCPHRSLAGLHLVRDWQRRTTDARGAEDRLAGRAGEADQSAVHQRDGRRPDHQVQVHHSPLLHLQ